MKKRTLTQKAARSAQMPTPQVADAIDEIVNDLLRRLRAGDRVTWPGLGTFVPEGGRVEFVAEPQTARRKRA
jgi:nucleoid DNA-binding protein